MKEEISHYDWLDQNLMTFFKNVGVDINNPYNGTGIIAAHGDKCYGYRYKFEENSIPFCHGVAIYLLTYVNPYSKECRENKNSYVDLGQWIVDNYEKFRPYLPKV